MSSVGIPGTERQSGPSQKVDYRPVMAQHAVMGQPVQPAFSRARGTNTKQLQ